MTERPMKTRLVARRPLASQSMAFVIENSRYSTLEFEVVR
jgi:hypothetical protein